MVRLFIDGISVEAKEGMTILEAAKLAKINIPTLCYLKKINEVGACRICVVEVEGSDRLVSSCNTPVEEGMQVHTNSEKVRLARKTNLELILSEHDCHCPTCVRNGNCKLQTLSAEMNVLDIPFEHKPAKNRWKASDILLRKDSKCVKCLRCISVCDKVQGLGVWELRGSGAHANVVVRGGANLSTVCSLCGQCVTHCPVGALTVRDDTEKVFAAINDPEKIVVAQVAPAVRAAWGEGLGIAPEIATEKRMAAAMRAIGADYVFDTNFSADLTIMEEGNEFIERLKNPDSNELPMFTSCCPGWVRFVKMEYPELVSNLSSAKSPQQMFGAVAKSYFAKKIGVEPEKIFCVSIMPCMAKKYECDVDEVNDASAKDVDAVITTREFVRMLKEKYIDVSQLPEEEFDSPLGESSGAGVIFGATGGVMEAALRTAYYLLKGENPPEDAFKAVRSTGFNQNQGIQEANFQIDNVTVRTAAVSGLGNARALLDRINKGEVHYDFVEVMACPGGCVGGGGQPIHDGRELAYERGQKLYSLDKNAKRRFSHENQDVQKMYEEYFVKPNSPKSHMLLHTEHKLEGF